MILPLLLLSLSPAFAKDITPAELAKQAVVIIKANGIVIPDVMINEKPPITAHGWIYTVPPTCGALAAASYLVMSDGVVDLSVTIMIPTEKVPKGVMVIVHDTGADGVADFMAQERDRTPIPDELALTLFHSALSCIVTPPAPKK